MKKLGFVLLITLMTSLSTQAAVFECKSTYEYVKSTKFGKTTDVLTTFSDESFKSNSPQDACLEAMSKTYLAEDNNGMQMSKLTKLTCKDSPTGQEKEVTGCH